MDQPVMDISPTSIPDVLLIRPKVHADERGFFMETFQARDFAGIGLPAHFVQYNHSGSRHGTLRGLHYQIRHAQDKLVQVIVGEVFEVAVDIRLNSPTFKKWVGVRVSAEQRLQLWVPQGFAHGIYTVSDWAEVTYQTTDYYDPSSERILLWNDPELKITWPLSAGQEPLLSKRDSHGKLLADAELFSEPPC
jgi:dTDP-4-dehydrorhamnose 3,5-epimerase